MITEQDTWVSGEEPTWGRLPDTDTWRSVCVTPQFPKVRDATDLPKLLWGSPRCCLWNPVATTLPGEGLPSF